MLACVSLLAFGIESWQAFLHWMPMFSRAFLTEGRAPWFKLQSIFGLVRYLGGSEQLGWAFQWTMTAAVATTVVMIWRSRVRYSLKAASLAVGALLATPYLFLYDMMVLAIPVGYLVRLGLAHGFRAYEVPALGVAMFLILVFLFTGLPVGLGATLIVGALVLRRAGPWWRAQRVARIAVPAGA
jgi:arabinofuranan 3-O-arabinosyltransferase